MRLPLTTIWVAAYVAVAIITYGRAAQECRMCDNSFQAATAAFMGATLWPLWWSWELQARK